MTTLTVDRATLAAVLHEIQDADTALLGKEGYLDAMPHLRRAALHIQIAINNRVCPINDDAPLERGA